MADGQTRAAPVVRKTARKRLEQAIDLFDWQAVTAIPDQKGDLRRFGTHPDTDFLAHRRMANGITQEISDQFTNQPGIARKLGVTIINFKIQPLLRNQGRQLKRRSTGKIAQMTTLNRAQRTTLFDFGQQEHLI